MTTVYQSFLQFCQNHNISLENAQAYWSDLQTNIFNNFFSWLFHENQLDTLQKGQIQSVFESIIHTPKTDQHLLSLICPHLTPEQQHKAWQKYSEIFTEKLNDFIYNTQKMKKQISR